MRKNTVIIILCTVFIILIFSACQDNTQQTSISITNTQMTTALDSNNDPVDSVTNYSTNAQQLILTATVNNAPEDTSLIFVWKHAGETIYTSEELDISNTEEYNVYAAITYDQLWDEGDYSVEIYANDDAEPIQTVDFTIGSK